MKLGINIDHVATLRQARMEDDPNVIDAASAALEGGADSITIHLREDRRHIQDQDVDAIIKHVPIVNLEMAATQEMLDIACTLKPHLVCLVPEKREELTTEGGLNVLALSDKLPSFIQTLHRHGIQVSLFIDPSPHQIDASLAVKADMIEIHTGGYAHQPSDLAIITQAVDEAAKKGLIVNAGHGLNYKNVSPIAALPRINELNIGHSIISRAVFVGLKQAVSEMKTLINSIKAPAPETTYAR